MPRLRQTDFGGGKLFRSTPSKRHSRAGEGLKQTGSENPPPEKPHWFQVSRQSQPRLIRTSIQLPREPSRNSRIFSWGGGGPPPKNGVGGYTTKPIKNPSPKQKKSSFNSTGSPPPAGFLNNQRFKTPNSLLISSTLPSPPRSLLPRPRPGIPPPRARTPGIARSIPPTRPMRCAGCLGSAGGVCERRVGGRRGRRGGGWEGGGG